MVFEISTEANKGGKMSTLLSPSVDLFNDCTVSATPRFGPDSGCRLRSQTRESWWTRTQTGQHRRGSPLCRVSVSKSLAPVTYSNARLTLRDRYNRNVPDNTRDGHSEPEEVQTEVMDGRRDPSRKT